MRNRRLIRRGLVFLVLVIGVVSSLRAEEAQSKTIKVFVSISPQAYFVERIGGSQVDVEVLVQPGHSPATFEPTPKQMAALSQADVYFRIGVPFEKHFLPKLTAANDRLRVVDTRQGVKLRPMEDGHGHSHGGGKDPHIWLDPKLVKIQAANIAEALADLDPGREQVFQENLAEFQADLSRLDSLIAEVLVPLQGKTLLVFHPSYGYFADAYGLKQIAVEMGGKEPGARQLARLIDRAKEDGVRMIFVQPQFSKGSARTIAEAIGGAVVPLDPLARDYLENLERMARDINRAFAGEEVE